MIEKTGIEGRIVDDNFRAVDKRQKLRGYIAETRLVAQKRLGDPVHFRGGGVNFTVRLQILVLMVAGQAPVDDFHAPDFNDPVPVLWLQARGFGIEHNLTRCH
jgi:hypothetical protein